MWISCGREFHRIKRERRLQKGVKAPKKIVNFTQPRLFFGQQDNEREKGIKLFN